jgi:hypothetical protein
MRRALTIITAVVALAVSAAPASAQVGATSSSAANQPVGQLTGTVAPPSSNGIIMRDGGVCDPIRHMGC